MPQVNAREIVAARGRRQAPAHLRSSGTDTVITKVSDVGFLPIPGPLDKTIAGLMSVQLPPGVPTGETYKVVLRQVSGRMPHKVLGTTEFRVKVGTATELLPKARHNLSVLRHVALAIPEANRWFPVFERYLSELEDRIRAFGGDPDDVVPSPTGHPDGGERPGNHDDKPVDCFTGKVRRLLYDCFGYFEAFVMYDCNDEVLFSSREKGIERVVLKACRHDLPLVVYFDPDTRRPRRLSLECGPWEPCPPPEGLERVAAAAQIPPTAESLPDATARAAGVARTRRFGPDDRGHGAHEH